METMHFHIAKISVLGQMFHKLGGQMNYMAHMRNCPEGCMVDQIRSRGNCNFYLPLFSLIHDLELLKKRLIKNCFRCLDLIIRVIARSKCFIYATKY